MEFNTLSLIAVLALFAHAGHTLHTVGVVRARNVASVVATTLVATASLVLLAFAFGHLLRWVNGDSSAGIVVGPGVFFASPGSFLSVLPLGLLVVALTIGSGAERATIRGVVIVAAALSLFALPAATALGWYVMSELDRPRADGSYGSAATLSAVTRVWPAIVADIVAAGGAIAFAKTLGPRVDKYNRDGSASTIPGHSLPTTLIGDLLLIVGLPMTVAAIAGDPAARLLNGILAGSASALIGVAVDWKRYRRVVGVGPWGAMIAGVIAGSIGAPAEQFLAIALGAIAGIGVTLASRKLDLKLRIDEPSSLALPHLFGASAGIIDAALAAAFEGSAKWGETILLATIGLSVAVVLLIVGLVTGFLASWFAKKLKWLRVDAPSEAEGLDLAIHDVNAYPDFQQPLIKSYDLRQ